MTCHRDIGTVVLLERARRRQRLQVGIAQELPVRIVTDEAGAITGVSLNGEALSFAHIVLPVGRASSPVPAGGCWSKLRTSLRLLRQQLRFLGTIFAPSSPRVTR